MRSVGVFAPLALAVAACNNERVSYDERPVEHGRVVGVVIVQRNAQVVELRGRPDVPNEDHRELLNDREKRRLQR